MSPRSKHIRTASGLSHYLAESLESRRLLTATLELMGSQNLWIGDTINVSNDGFSESGTALDVNPTNPLCLAGVRPGDGETLNVFHSSDGGNTWLTNEIAWTDDGYAGNRVDPSVAFDADGKLYIAYCLQRSDATHVIVGMSPDGGTTFDYFRQIATQSNINSGPGMANTQLATGLEPSSGNQAVYVAYVRNYSFLGEVGGSAFVAGSRDAGDTWTEPSEVTDGSLHITIAEFPDPAVGPNGELYVCWREAYSYTKSIKFDRNMDGLWLGGATWGEDITAYSLAPGVWNKKVPAQPQYGINTCPVLDVDCSGGGHNGDLYIAFIESYGRNDTDIVVSRSSSQGGSWSTSNIFGGSGTEFDPWIDVDQNTGSVNVLYYSTEGDQSTDNDDVRPMLSYSIDGAVTWSMGFMSAQLSNETGGFAGDYRNSIGLAVHDGTAHALWASRHGDSSDLDAFTAPAAFVGAGANQLQITGRTGLIWRDESMEVRLSPQNTDYVEVWESGVREFTGMHQGIDSINIQTNLGTDTITVESPLPYTENIAVYPGAANDTINLWASAPGTAVTLHGEYGDDSFVLGTGDLDAIRGSVVITGDTEFDWVTMNDSTSSFGDPYSITSTSIDRPVFGLLTYDSVESINLNGQAGNNVFNVTSTLPSTPVRLDGGDGNDTFLLGTGDLGALPNSIIVSGGAGNDSITLNDTTASSSDTYDITSTTVDRLFFGKLTYDTVENIALNAGNGDNTFNVTSTHPSTPVALDGGMGNDSFVLGSGNLDALVGNVSIYGFTGTDSVVLNDSAAAHDDAYTILTSSVTRPRMGLITYSTVESLLLAGAGGNNTFNIQETFQWTPVTVHGGNGNDSFVLGTGNLDSISSSVAVYGDAGTDSVSLDDSAMVRTDPYVITSTGVQFPYFAMTYNSLERLALNGSSHFNVNSTLASTPVILNGGAGDDSFVLGMGNLDLLAGNITVNGNAGTDTITVNDAGATHNSAYSIDGTSLQRPNAGIVTYGTVERLAVSGATGNNAFNVTSTSASTPVTLNGGDGNDTFVLGTGNLGTLGGEITAYGDAGADLLTLDDSATSFLLSYTVTSSTVSVLSFRKLTYWTVEGITLNAGIGDSTFNVTGTTASTPVTLNGGAGNDSFKLGTGNLDALQGNVTGNGDAGTDAVTLNDSTAVTGGNYVITASTVDRPVFGMLTYGTVESLVLNSAIGNNTLSMSSKSQSTSVTLNGGVGNDSFTFGGGDLYSVGGILTVNGNSGTDSVILDDTAPAILTHHYEITEETAGWGTGVGKIAYGTVESILLLAASGDNAISVGATASTTPVTVNGGGGNDTFDVGAGDIDSNLLSLVSIIGGGGTDSLNISDTSDDLADSYSIDLSQVSKSSGGTIQFTTIESLNLDANPADNTLTVNNTFDGSVRINAGAGADTISVVESYPGRPVIVDGGVDLDTVHVNSDALGSAAVQFPDLQDLATLHTYNGGAASLVPGGSSVLRLRTLSIDAGSQLDLTDNFMIVDYLNPKDSPFAKIRDLIIAGYASGAWNGSGINSSTAAASPGHAIGYAEATAVFTTFPATFGGQAVPNRTVLVRYTNAGEADLDGKVNTLDFNRLAGNFGGTAKVFSQGDFNYDRTVDSTDFSILVSQYGKTLPATAPVAVSSLQSTSPTASPFGDAGIHDTEDGMVSVVT